MKCSNQVVQPCDACIELANLDATPAISHNFLNLIHKQHRNKFNLNLFHDVLASRLPNEIISLIFIFLDKTNEPGTLRTVGLSIWRQHWDHLLRTPTLLSMVCRRWQSIVMRTLQLWKNIMFKVWTQSVKLELLKEFLSRSGSLPLSLVFYADKFGENFTESQLELIANVIRSHSARWETLDITHAPKRLAYKLLHNLDNMPASDFFNLRTTFFDPRLLTLRKPLRPYRFSLQATLSDAVLKIPPRILQWDNVVSLELNRVSISTLCDLFQQMPRLTFCHLVGVTTLARAALQPLPKAPIIVPSLEHLKVSFQEADSVWFHYLTLPGLMRLECHFNDGGFLLDLPRVPLEDMIDFVARSRLDSKSLHMFELRYSIYSMNYDPKFTDLTTITHLSIVIQVLFNQEDGILNSYLSRISDISILLHLRKFSIRTPTILPSSWRLLCNIFRGGFLPLTNASASASDSTVMTLQDSSLRRQYHERPLEHVSVEAMFPDLISPIPYEEYLILKDIQDGGVIKLHLRDCAGGNLLEQMAKVYETVSLFLTAAE